LALKGIIAWVNLNEERWGIMISVQGFARAVQKTEKGDYVKRGKERGMMHNGEGVPLILIRRRKGRSVCKL
jgi:hypothetical protein